MRVIIVEDQRRLGQSIKRGLERKGFAVDHYENGDEAADHMILHHALYDAMILDLMLPGRSGMDVCRVLRERGIRTPILILTAKDATSDKVVMLNYGADDYLTKPFSFAELIARLQAIMRRPENVLQTELVVGDLRLDPNLHKVFQKEKEVKLTTKEFALLEFFMRHPDQVLNRELILDHVWDFDFNSLSNIVDVHVKNLRKKLGHSQAQPIIETVEGVGYRLISQV